VVPQYPYCEQHSPSAAPIHVYPLVPPQVASGDVTRLLGVAVGAVLLAALLATLLAPDEAGALEELPQVPKTLWQPVPQWSVEEPQYPY
jgi:hypothetical protein